MAEMTMRERVARAICRANWLSVAGEQDFDKGWSDWLPEADAAIAAMREQDERHHHDFTSNG